MTTSTNTSTDDPIGIAGTGRMAKAIGALLRQRGCRIAAVAGRVEERTVAATAFIGGGEAVSFRNLPRHASRILIAVADDAVADIASVLADGGLENGVVLHTSGGAGLEALASLRATGNSLGVLHPLQTVPSPERGIENLPGATFAFAGSSKASDWAGSLIRRLDGRPLAVLPQFWQRYHAAAVMACNYHVAMVDAALELMETAGIRRTAALDALSPILRSTTENVIRFGPEIALTGPIRRGDVGTVRRHLAALSASPHETGQLYRAAGLQTLAIARRAGLPPDAAREIAAALKDESHQ